MDANLFWDNVKRLVKEQKTTQAKLAEDCGISFRNLQNQISRNIFPQVDDASKIAQALGVTVDYLITGKDPSKPDISGTINKIESALEDLKKL